jgi:hypothetical protein
LRTSNEPLRTYILVDAAYAIHADCKSQSAAGVGIGNKDYNGATVLFKSTKQSIVAKSSSEAELIAASDQTGEAIHIDSLLRSQGYENMLPPILYQDNSSTITLIEKGKPTSYRSKHIKTRKFWLHDRQKTGDIVIEHLPTEQMYINVLTKPLQGKQFIDERNALTRWINPNEELK